MRQRSLLFVCVIAASTVRALIGCSTKNCGDTGTCTPQALDASVADESFADSLGEPDAPTDPCVNTPNDPKCINEDTAFFVSLSKGDDVAGVGSRDKPFKSAGVVLGKLTATKKRIYVCEGTYPEDIVLNATHAGVSIFGGVACDWTPAQVQPLFGKTTTALRVDGAGGVAIADVAFKAIDATAAGGSSIAAFVSNAEVTFKHVALTAGMGAAAGPAVATSFNLPTDLNGNDGMQDAGSKVVVCPGGLSTTGGRGGPASGFPGLPGLVGPDNHGSVSICSGPGSVNTDGKAGVSADPNAVAPATIGDLTADGWHPGDGAIGGNGTPGQGGGGGFSLGGGVGGGGGAGGCGGSGGAGGKGGGASIALTILQATVHATTSTFAASSGGNGTDGLSGQLGTKPGGLRGTGSVASCNGGNGGAGGNGAAGGGGAGGVSTGVVYKGAAPDLDEPTTSSIVTGTEGTHGAGPGTPGPDFTKAPTLKIN